MIYTCKVSVVDKPNVNGYIFKRDIMKKAMDDALHGTSNLFVTYESFDTFTYTPEVNLGNVVGYITSLAIIEDDVTVNFKFIENEKSRLVRTYMEAMPDTFGLNMHSIATTHDKYIGKDLKIVKFVVCKLQDGDIISPIKSIE